MKHIKNLVFDLDGTLYPETDVIKQRFLDKMIDFFKYEMGIVSDDYMALIDEWRKKYGTCTPAVKEHGGNVAEYMDYAGDIDVSDVEYNHELRNRIEKLSYRKIIYTNSCIKHTEDILDRLQMSNMFDEVFTIVDADYLPKPDMKSYKMLLEKYKLNPSETVLFEDKARNLEPAKELGMTTVLITDRNEKNISHVDYIFADINEAIDLFLKG